MPQLQRVKRRVRLRDLDTLLVVAQAHGMRKAAEQLQISQPAVSKAVRELEDVLGVTLLDRMNRRSQKHSVGSDYPCRPAT